MMSALRPVLNLHLDSSADADLVGELTVGTAGHLVAR
jgi:hypothetical protein